MKHQTSAPWFRLRFTSSVSLPSFAIGSILLENFKKHHSIFGILVYFILKRKLQRAIGPSSFWLFTQVQALDQNIINATKETYKPTSPASWSKFQTITLQSCMKHFYQIVNYVFLKDSLSPRMNLFRNIFWAFQTRFWQNEFRDKKEVCFRKQQYIISIKVEQKQFHWGSF